MSHEITTPSGNTLFGLWLSDADWQDDSFPDLEPLIVGIQREAAAAERKATVERAVDLFDPDGSYDGWDVQEQLRNLESLAGPMWPGGVVAPEPLDAEGT